MIKLQTLVFPGKDLPQSEALYFHVEQGAIVLLSQSKVLLPRRSVIWTETFFNGFSLGKWRSNCQIDDLGLALTGTGRVLVRIGMNILDHASRWLSETEIHLSDMPTQIDIEDLPQLGDGILFFQITALEDATLTGGYYFTRATPLNDVRLGIVVTHFNRKHYVLPAIRRVTTQLLNDPEIEGRIELVVVDNSSNITAEEARGVTLIPNLNLGGAGGFTRGLLHLKDNGFSHCLFMDDDASCEIESIRRTLRILQFARAPNLAIAGSMLREATPHVLHESGAIFKDGVFLALKQGLDLRHFHNVLLAETEERIGYGAWWHFAFRIDHAKQAAFPFFVRGDDIVFSLSNDFDIMTMNGIAVWAEDFAIKESPTVRYLSLRSNLVIFLLHSRRGAARMVRIYRRLVRDSLYSYNYSGARACTLAMQHVLQGPNFWRDNIDMVAVRAELARQCPGEKIDAITLPSDLDTRPDQESRWHRLFRKVTMNGFLLPERLIYNKTMLDRKTFTGDPRKTYRFRRVLYQVPNSKTGYVATHDKRRFWEEYRLARKTAKRFAAEFETLRKSYTEAFPQLSSEAFWRDVYAKAPQAIGGQPLRQGQAQMDRATQPEPAVMG